tara:strand:+ start:710 stop:1009 length:300 start_codon:yes stop_codon:yes gene_type:complete
MAVITGVAYFTTNMFCDGEVYGLLYPSQERFPWEFFSVKSQQEAIFCYRLLIEKAIITTHEGSEILRCIYSSSLRDGSTLSEAEKEFFRITLDRIIKRH